jgi:hypothetical protein
MAALLAVGAGALLAPLPLACTGQSSFVIPPVDAGPVSTRYEAPCAAWATAVCAREQQCPWYSDYQWDSPAQCLERSTLICEVVASDPNVVFDEQQMLACQYPTDCTVLVRDLPIDCLPPGRSPDGATCVFHEACQSGECLEVEGQSGPCGTCQSARSSCAAGCPTGDVCGGVAADGGMLCVPVNALGAPCRVPGDCEFYCSFQAADSGDGFGVCVGLATQGEACGDGVPPGDPTGRPGPPCAGTNLTCDDTNHCTAIPPAPDGEVCDDSQGLGCLPPAQCFGQRCLYPSLAYCPK